MQRLAKLIIGVSAVAFAAPAFASEPPVTDNTDTTTDTYTLEDGTTVTSDGAVITVDPAEDVAGEVETTDEPGLDSLEGETDEPDMTEDMWGTPDADDMTDASSDASDDADEASDEAEAPLDY